MRRSRTDSSIEIWTGEDVNANSLAYPEKAICTLIQIEPGSKESEYIVEVVNYGDEKNEKH